MQSLCTLRHHCRQWQRNTRYQAGATRYLGRTCTGWIAPACRWRTYSITSSERATSGQGKAARYDSERELRRKKYPVGSSGSRSSQILPALPDTFVGNSRASEITVSSDGRFVYASNRGFDSVAVFGVDGNSGRLTPVTWMAAEGKTPRFFVIAPTENFLFAANEDSDTIVTFAVDKKSGALSKTSHTGTSRQPGVYRIKV